MNTVIGILIGALVLAGIIYALVSKNSIIKQQMDVTPFYMKAIGVTVFLSGVLVAILAGLGVIGTGGSGNMDWILVVSGLGLGSVFGLLFCVGFYAKSR